MATDWTYGIEGNAYPVRTGQTWRVGDHVFLCSDIVRRRALDSVVASTPISLVYTDPPWGQGLLNGFQTKAGLPHADYSYLELYERIVDLAGNRPLYVETGNREAAKVSRLLPGPQLRAYPITYAGKNPATLLYSGPSEPVTGLDGLDDEDTPGAVLRALPTGTVLDPCAGRGLTSRAAHLSGWQSLNNELSPYRVSAALYRLARLTDMEPEQIR